MEGSSNDPWKAINQILEGKMPFVQMPNSMNNEGCVRNIIDDIVTRTMNTVSMGAEKVNPHKEKTG